MIRLMATPVIDNNFHSKNPRLMALKRTAGFFSTLLTTSLLMGCAVYQPGFEASESNKQHYNIQSVEKDIVYSNRSNTPPLKADLYLPGRGDLIPVVITIHGGGWSGRSRGDIEAVAKKLTRRGYAVFNISYHFAPDFKYPTQLHDVQDALRWIDQNHRDYNLDRNRINTWGYSSGAHLAALTAAETDSTDPLPPVNAVVAGGIPADLSVYSNSPIIIPFIGGNRGEKADTYRQASPINHITPEHPPVFLFHGKNDGLVEVEQSINYHHALQDQGIKSELYLHRLWGHFAMFLFGWDAEDKALDFLDHYNGRLPSNTAS